MACVSLRSLAFAPTHHCSGSLLDDISSSYHRCISSTSRHEHYPVARSGLHVRREKVMAEANLQRERNLRRTLQGTSLATSPLLHEMCSSTETRRSYSCKHARVRCKGTRSVVLHTHLAGHTLSVAANHYGLGRIPFVQLFPSQQSSQQYYYPSM